MTPEDLLSALSSLRPEWHADVTRVLADGALYECAGTIGQETFAALLAGSSEPWIATFFELVERALALGAPETKDLVVVGVFEAMQNASFAAGPPDVVEARLGPVSATAWADLIEGWTGPGIRTVAAWRAASLPPVA